MSNPLPKSELMRGVLPYLVMRDTMAAIAFYERAFGAELVEAAARDQTGRVMNASLIVNDGVLMLMDDISGNGAYAATEGKGMLLQLVVADGKGWWTRAIAAGCTEVDPYGRKPWGDDWGRLRDPFGLDWAILEPSAAHLAAAAAR